MRIAQVSPLYESVPPKLYGGTERVIHYITEELVKAGHEVTLFASGDSDTSATLVPVCEKALRLDESCIDPHAHHILLLEQVYRRISEFDLIHFHIDYLHFPLSRRMSAPHLTTLHGRLDLPDLQGLYREFTDMPVVSISDSQRIPLAFANWQATVHHGLPPDLYDFHAEPKGEYLAFIGRVSPEKGVDKAVEIARRAGMKIKVAAKIDNQDYKYYKDNIEELFRQPHVEFIGEIGEDDKEEFLGNARAMLFAIDWPEPFGLVLLEAMACGTPTIAFPRGSVPEIITDGANGIICNSVNEAVRAVSRLDTLERSSCRLEFERRFTSARMAGEYVSLYMRMSGSGRKGEHLVEEAA